MKICVVFLHEDCFGPEWDYLEKIFDSKTKADAYVEQHDPVVAANDPERPHRYSWVIKEHEIE